LPEPMCLDPPPRRSTRSPSRMGSTAPPRSAAPFRPRRGMSPRHARSRAWSARCMNCQVSVRCIPGTITRHVWHSPH